MEVNECALPEQGELEESPPVPCVRSSSEPTQAFAECESYLKGRDKVGSLKKSQLADLVNDRGDLWVGRSLCRVPSPLSKCRRCNSNSPCGPQRADGTSGRELAG